jgi:hypothetical protein
MRSMLTGLGAGIMLGLAVSSVAAAPTRLVTDGRSDYRIVIPKDAIPSERHAAKELQSFLKQISGAELAIIDDAQPLPEAAILLGKNAHLAQLNADIDWPKLGQEGFTIRTVGSRLIIAGGRPRGTMYGVYTFLEGHLGCRWFSSKVSRIPKLPTIVLGDINDTQEPVLEYREPFWFDAFDADWAARNKCNSSSARLDEARGGKIVYTGFVHTFNSLVPPEKYYDQHPEYFSLIGGKRMKGYYQLCLTNPDVLRISIQAVKDMLKSNPATNIISVSQNDAGGWCECDNCKKVEAEEGGVHAGPIIRFVNAVAEAIEKEYPNAAVDTLAYQYSRAPVTKTRPRRNVIVRLCSIECCFSHTLAQEDTSFKKDIVGWSKMCDRVYIWDYVTTFGHYVLPFTNNEVLQPNVQFFVKHGVKGIFEQGAYQSTGGQMAELKAYLLAKILWDPECYVEKHRAEFMDGFYGKAAGPIDRYLRMLRDHAIENKVHQPIWIGPESGQAPPELMARAALLFDEAEKAVANDPETLHRVQVARLPIQYVALSRLKLDTSRPWAIRGDKYGSEPDSETAKLCNQFFAVCRKENVTHLNEGAFHPEAFYKQVVPKVQGTDLVTLENPAVRIRVAPALGGRILTIEDKAKNRSLLAMPAATTPGFPNVGGYWESAGLSRKSPGATDAFTAESAPGQMTLTASLSNGLVLKRVIRLVPDAAAWTIDSSLTNAAQEPRAARLRTSLGLSLGGENVVLKADDREAPMTIPANANAFRMAFSGKATPGNAWTLSGPSGAAVRCQVTGEPTRFLFVNRVEGPTVVGVGMTPEKTLQPKESLSLSVRYDLIAVPERAATKGEHAPGEVEIPCDEFGLYREGEMSGLKEDATALEGVAAWMNGNHHEWAIQWALDPVRIQHGATYEAKAIVRFDVKGQQGGACTFGVYDGAKKAGLCGGGVSAADAKGEWQTVTLGRFKVDREQYVWIAPASNADNIAGVYVDRLIFRRVDERAKP